MACSEHTSKHGVVTNESTCRSCGAPVLWVVTPAGRKMPVDVETDDSHFATCPQSKNWRKPKGAAR